MCLLRCTLKKKQSEFNLHFNTFFQVRLGVAGQEPCFLFSSLSTSACQLLRMCANSLKRPRSSLCQESLWQTRWTKTWQLQSDSLGDIYQLWRAENTVERQWNKPLCILIICSEPGPNWNDRKQYSVLIKTVNNLSVLYLWIFCHCHSSITRLLLWQAICAAVLFCKSGVERGSMWGAGFNYAWVSAPWRVHNKASRDGAKQKAQTNWARSMLIQGLA